MGTFEICDFFFLSWEKKKLKSEELVKNNSLSV